MGRAVIADGQQTLDGTEIVDRRVERAARALWKRDAHRSFGADSEGAEGTAARLWPRVRSEYVQTARVALDAAGQS